MAKYSLILRDATYTKLLIMASERHISLGKFINEILDKLTENIGKTIEKTENVSDPSG